MKTSLTPRQALQQYFGFEAFREGQEATIQRILAGKHTLLVMPTGSGKSLAYQLPALLKPGLSLVISPLIALMKDQVDALTEAGLPATYINSSLPGSELNRRLRAVREGHVKLLYIAPERLRNRQFTRALANTKISLLAVDEAHCISQWGHDFRPDYLQIGPTWQAMGRPTLLATTATATPKVQQDIIKLLGVKNVKTTVTGFNRPNLTLRVVYAPDERTKLDTLRGHLQKTKGSVIVYCATRRNTEDVASYISGVLKRPARAYHAGLDRDTRYQTQTDFMAGRFQVVVATNAFGMGVDKADVRAVIHYNMPATVEAYYQEAGRAGRDGQPAECVLCFAPDDERLQAWMINSDTPTHDDLHQLYTRLEQAATEGEVYFARRELADVTGLHPVKVRVTLSELEQAGAIYHMGTQRGYDHWKVQPLDHAALNKQAATIQQRAQIRLELLEQILEYVHLTGCRRKFLLNYFGDTSPPRSPRCCDNHTADTLEDLPKAVTPQEWYPLIVLETVRTFEYRPVGRTRLAQLLNGSQAKGMEAYGYTRHKFYGKLDALSQPQITAIIDALIKGRYLRISGGELPVLNLTESGQKALEARAALPIKAADLPAPGDRSGAASARSRRSDQPHTAQITLDYWQQGLTPAQIATKRELAEQTIYNHLAQLIGEGKLDLHDVVPPEIEAQVLEAVETVGSAFRLSPLKTVLPAEISFDQIRCVLAAHPNLPRHIPQAGEPEKAAPQPSPKLQTPKSPSSPAPEDSPVPLILDAVAKLGGTLGRTGLSQFLSGSRASWLDAFTGHSCYGLLSNMSQKAILNIIDALITEGQLETTGGGRPKVVLPEQSPHHPAPQPKDKQPDAPPEISPPTSQSPHLKSPDPHLLETLRTWRTEQAKAQRVPPYIVFPNKVIAAIAAQKPATLAELGKISGVGPARLEQYGAAVLALVAGQKPPPAREAAPGPSIKEEAARLNQADSEPVSTAQTLSPEAAIRAVVADLEGLLTVDTLAQLLTAGPDDIVPFSDQEHCGAFYRQLSAEEMATRIETALQNGEIALSPQQRLTVRG